MANLRSFFAGIGRPKIAKGFFWSSNSPYLRDVWVRVRRIPRAPVSPPNIGRDANPAAIIYEVMTDQTWGIGAPVELMDLSSFANAATTLFQEKLGLSLTWSNQTTAEDFINLVLDHIDGLFFVNPRTGLHTLRLARDDYDPDTLRTITPDIAQMVSFQWRGWGETSNEMQVTWTNPENEQEEVVILQDLGNIAQQGAVVSASKNFFGARSAKLAMQLCARELRKAASPAVTCELMLLRHGWDLVPGDVVKLTWPDYGVVSSIQRIVEVDYGAPGDPYIRIKMSEDVFSMSRAEYNTPQGSEWEDTSTDPAPMTHHDVLTLPSYLAVTVGGADLHTVQFPSVLSGILAASAASDSLTYELGERITLPTGEMVWDDQGVKSCLTYGLLRQSVEQEPTSTWPLDVVKDAVGGAVLDQGLLLLIGTGTPESREFAMVREITDTGIGVDRGVLDTIPQEWAANTPVWFVPPDATWEYLDETENSAGAVVSYRLLPITTRGTLEFDDAPDVNAMLTDRPYCPLRPADVKVNGVGWGIVDLTHLHPDSVVADVTWALRNRLTEDAVVLRWEDPGVTPEAGQLTDIVVRSVGGSEISREAGISGEAGQIDLTSLVDPNTSRSVYIGATATRDGFESIQSHAIQVWLPKPFDMMQDVFSDPEVEGVWFDPSDITTLFQDALGTTPVLADGDPVGLMLDKHASGSWVQVNTVESVDGTPPGATVTRYPVADVVAGNRYLIEFDVVDYDGTGQVGMAAGPFGSASGNFTRGAGDRSYRSCVVCNTSGPLELFTRTTNTCNFRNIRVLEITGNHATQDTDDARPTYRTDGALHWLEFDGVDDKLPWGPIPYTGDISICGAMERTDSRDNVALRSRGDATGYYALIQVSGSTSNQVTYPAPSAGGNFVNGQRFTGRRMDLFAIAKLVGSVEKYPAASSAQYQAMSISYGHIIRSGRLWGYVEVEKPAFGVQRAQLEYWMAAKAGLQWW